ncbi:response regulator [Polaribacter sp. PL03]|uniref:response regulator n=1 Tax=Polaribacter sp. PL03 TaxID=3088353 RepID=UPI0029CEAC3F|nr:response regulator [Polaribacter sp. PL03]MDX6746009.1 response regulator [Polaribacter sp. PL03]
MKILAIDDQKLVLIPLESRLKEMGYEVITETDGVKGIELFDSFKPDLVIVDINMPTISGLEIVKHIRKVKNSNIPIMILSGNTDDEMITQGFELGVNDYMKKPLSLTEVGLRTKRLIGAPENMDATKKYSNTIIQERCVGVVIPCYNEEERLLSKEFTDYIDKNSGYHLCFVNDGSKDKTLEVLNNLRKGREDFITVYDCEKNGGKAEAVRQGMLYMAKQEDLDYIGFLDADLSTDLADFNDLVTTIENSDYKIVSGSRISRMGANITKESARKVISMSINFIIRKILSMDFKDTQCGAKIFHKDVIDVSFKEKFVTQWIFDVEIFRRITLHYGLDKAKQMLCEQPLKRWIHADGSKLSMKDSVKIVGQLGQIAWYYRKGKK